MQNEVPTKEECEVEELDDGLHYFDPETNEELYFEPNYDDDFEQWEDELAEESEEDQEDIPEEFPTDDEDDTGEEGGEEESEEPEEAPESDLPDYETTPEASAENEGVATGFSESSGGFAGAEAMGEGMEALEVAGTAAETAEAGGLLATTGPWLLLALVILVIAVVAFSLLSTMTKGGSARTSGGIAPTSGAEWPDNVIKKGKGWTLKDNTDYSGYSCATGSKDGGTYKHPTRGFTIRKCQTKIGVVASIISQRALDMIQAAEKDGITLRGGGFRSYEEQEHLYNQNCSGGSCHPPTARPGNSQHERGLATDFQNEGGGTLRKGDSAYKWLTSNGGKYGYINLPSESWHWSMSGN